MRRALEALRIGSRNWWEVQARPLLSRIHAHRLEHTKEMLKHTVALFAVPLLVLITACGGGGGGGGSAEQNSRGVRLLHGALYAPPADVRVDGALTSSAVFRFGQKTGTVGLDEGTHRLTVLPHGVESIVGTFTLDYRNSARPLLLLWQSDPESVRLNLLQSTSEAPAGQQTLIRIVPAVIGIDAAILEAGDTRIRAAAGTASPYSAIEESVTSIRVTGSSRGGPVRELASLTAALASGRSYTVFVTGESDYFVRSELIED